MGSTTSAPSPSRPSPRPIPVPNIMTPGSATYSGPRYLCGGRRSTRFPIQRVRRKVGAVRPRDGARLRVDTDTPEHRRILERLEHRTPQAILEIHDAHGSVLEP